MTNERIYFIDGDDSVYLDTYIADEKRGAPRDAMIVFPGGAYLMICSDREGEPIALNYLARGVNSFVVRYSIGDTVKFPRQLLDAARAFAYVKEHAQEFNVNPERIFISGFSAGGHLAGSLTTLHNYAENILGYEKDYCKPRGAVLCYPVVTAYEPTHIPSFEYLFRKPYSEITKEEKELVSLECNIKGDTPPMFIWHTATDELVPPHGSINLARAYCDIGRSVAFHLYPYGPHGVALANEVTNVDEVCKAIKEAEGWLSDSVSWMKSIN